jgi:glycosyltransferase involved in cell wall biosynthesis
MHARPVVAIVGDGPMRAELAERARARGWNDRLLWCGAVNGAGQLMKAFDAFVLSSRTEGTPMVLLEAMAAGVPIVSTAVGGIPDVVSENEAILVPSEEPRALGHALDEVLQDTDSAALRAARALQRLHREYDAEHWVQRYAAIYTAVQGRRRAVAVVS